MLAAFKFARIKWGMARFMAEASLGFAHSRDLWTLRQRWLPLISKYGQHGLDIMNIQVDKIGEIPAAQAKGRLFVGNHMSYIDILILSSLLPASFVTSQEIRETPLLGWLCTLSGCVFVERRNKNNIHREISEITEALNRGMNVVIFPEATSTPGDEILRFRKALFTAALDADTEVVPFCLNYLEADGASISLENRDHFCWYGDMSFAPHLMNLLGYKSVKVSVDFLPAMEARGFSDPADLANFSQAQVSSKFSAFRNRISPNKAQPSQPADAHATVLATATKPFREGRGSSSSRQLDQADLGL